MAYTSGERIFTWDRAKNDWLKARRNVSFETAVERIVGDGLLDDIEHPDQDRYPGQRVFIIRIGDYAYLVPFRETAESANLITIIPNRKMTRKYIGRRHGETE